MLIRTKRLTIQLENKRLSLLNTGLKDCQGEDILVGDTFEIVENDNKLNKTSYLPPPPIALLPFKENEKK
jgi:hypothetical protein